MLPGLVYEVLKIRIHVATHPFNRIAGPCVGCQFVNRLCGYTPKESVAFSPAPNCNGLYTRYHRQTWFSRLIFHKSSPFSILTASHQINCYALELSIIYHPTHP
jgi:hypothetical protein